MDTIIDITRKKPRKLVLRGKSYVYAREFAERVGVSINTVYQWRSSGRVRSISEVYAGWLVFDEKAIEPFMETLFSR